MSRYKDRVAPVVRKTDTRHEVITDGDLFVPDWEKIDKYNPLVQGVKDLKNRRSSGLSCVLEFRWDHKNDRPDWWRNPGESLRYARLFLPRDDGKRLESNIFWGGKCSMAFTSLFEYLVRYHPEIRIKKPKKMKRSWS
jgi:hypothetical protein